ncbi:MAG: esterase family protein, partial [Anaerolineales bacterium]|nr:esterase family protein [Anaerolineales bacterium]
HLNKTGEVGCFVRAPHAQNTPHPKLLRSYYRIVVILMLGVFLLGCSTVPSSPPLQEAAPLRSGTPSLAAFTALQNTLPPESTPLPPAESTPLLSATQTATLQAMPIPASSTPSTQPGLLDCLGAGGEIQRAELATNALSDALQYRVYVPPCYDEQPELSYAVLYLIHGWDADDEQWERLGVADVADALIAGGKIAPFLIVMPRDRIMREPANDGFGQALVSDLVPWIDAQYRTRPVREMRAIGGISRGAAWALHLGLLYFDLFGGVGMHSGFVFYSDFSNVASWLDQIPAESRPRFYLDVGDKDSPTVVESAAWFEAQLTQRAIEHEWHFYVGNHDEAYWGTHLEQYLRWYSQGWK